MQEKCRRLCMNMTVADQHYDESGNWIVNVRLPVTDWHKLNKRLDGQLDAFLVK